MSQSPILLWLRRDLRLSDHPALEHAARSGRPVVPVFIHDESCEALGAAPRFRLGLSLRALRERLRAIGSDLVLRRGAAGGVLDRLIRETGADTVLWSRAYDPDGCARDAGVTAALEPRGITVGCFGGHLLFEPEAVQTGQGGPYRVFTPFWNAVRDRDPGAPGQEISVLRAPEAWPASDRLSDWDMAGPMRRGAGVVADYLRPGELAAQGRLAGFLDGPVRDYAEGRDFPMRGVTSGLSDHLAWGEIGPRAIWAGGWRALRGGAAGAETFLKELVWREFAYHLMCHTPHLLTDNWRPDWDGFAWRQDPDSAEVRAWKQGRTGEPFVDAAMRELYVTGRMHNRARMITASYLTKHLLCDWRIGRDWFADCLTDWDPASNAMGWQWVAGSGPDAAPYFRIFNPATQAQKFDPTGAYRQMWIAEAQSDPPQTALDYFRAVPKSWGLSPHDTYPAPIVDLAAGRARALEAYQAYREEIS